MNAFNVTFHRQNEVYALVCTIVIMLAVICVVPLFCNAFLVINIT